MDLQPPVSYRRRSTWDAASSSLVTGDIRAWRQVLITQNIGQALDVESIVTHVSSAQSLRHCITWNYDSSVVRHDIFHTLAHHLLSSRLSVTREQAPFHIHIVCA